MKVRSLWKEVALVGCVAAAGTVLGTSGAAMAAGDLSAAPGVVSHINIVSDKSEDISSPEAWKKTYIKEGMTDEQKAIAVWRTVVKYRHQENPPDEGLQSGNVHEPFKTFHVYGYGMCCCAASNIEGLNRYLGLPARGRIINQHSVPEVWYDQAWHLYDASLMFYLKKPDGSGVASVDEMKKSIQDFLKDHPGEFHGDVDWRNFGKNEGWKKGPVLFQNCEFYDKDGINRAGWHGWWSNMTEYNWKQASDIKYVVPPDTQATYNVYDYGAILGYQLNVQLREGEKLTRCWTATQVASGLSRNNPKGFEKFLEGDMRSLGLQKDMGDLSPGRVGNGVLEYDATADSKLTSDALVFENLKVEGGKIRVVDASKPGTLIVRMSSSYLFLDGEMSSIPVVGDGGSVKASLSLNNGLDWTELNGQAGEVQKTDLKPLVFNKYDYRVKLVLTGVGTGLDGLKFVHAVQHSQAPLPLITEGENKINFSAGPSEGTVTIQGQMDGKSGGKVLTIGDFHPVLDGIDPPKFRVGGTGSGTAMVPIATPGEMTRIRMGVHWRARDPKDGFTVEVSFDKGATWKPWTALDLANPGRSTYVTFSDVPAGAREAEVRFTGTQKNTACIFDLRLDADYKEPAGGFRPVKVTYTWEEGVPQAKAAATAAAAPLKGKEKTAALAAVDKVHGTPKTDVHVCASPTESWTINCAPGMKPVSYTVELAK